MQRSVPVTPRLGTAVRSLVVSAAMFLFPLAPAAAENKAEQARNAAKLVEQTLRTEAAEGVPDRVELLRPILATMPHYEAAFWHCGYVFGAKEKEWLRYDDTARSAAKDQRLTAYREIRDQYAQTVEGQAALARWCEKHKLPDQARSHWTRVLELAPDNLEARGKLGFRMAGGNWVSEQAWAQAFARIQTSQAALREWRPKLEKIYRGLQQQGRPREAARKQLLSITDPKAVGAIELVLCASGGEVALEGVEALRSIRVCESAEALARQAAFSPWEAVRKAAAVALRAQRLHDYVPLLLGAMQSPVQSRAQIYQSANGFLLYRHIFVQEGPDQRELAVLDSPYQYIPPSDLMPPVNLLPGAIASPQGPRRKSNSNGGSQSNSGGDNSLQDEIVQANAMNFARAQAAGRAAQREAAAAQYNATAEQVNARVGAALAEATEETRPSSPIEWWNWWDEYNEVYVPSEKPVMTFYQSGGGATFTSAYPLRMDCLSGKTPVWTELGPIPIEEVRVGDRVFACDPETGCLALKPVLRKTLRPEGRQLSVRAGENRIETSGGHVFWVAGQGWVKARELKEGMQLHTIRGTVAAERIQPGSTQKSFNLVVADFHTFFAGQARILTHDNTVRQPTNRVVPGLALR
ncbi:MAG: polymorphic toxin-type HINT domain-containing protein [Thermoguttaceae bacterium]